MTPEQQQAKEEEARIYQARMMVAFKQTETYQFILNTLEAKRIVYAKERQKMMRLASTRDNCLYFTGKEDAVWEFIETINQTILDGEIIEAQREFIRQNQEVEDAAK